MKTTTEAVQIHGGYGFVKEYHVERLMRDAKSLKFMKGCRKFNVFFFFVLSLKKHFIIFIKNYGFIMKKILILLIGLVSLTIHAQTVEQINKYMRFVPSNMKASDINPSDIPSEDILRQMGLSDEEISEAMDYKYQRGKYNPNYIDTTGAETNLIQSALFHDSMNDSLFDLNDSIIYPSAKIYGQDFFRNNSISFFSRAYDNQAPDNYFLGENDELTISIWGLAEHSGGRYS